MPTKTLPELGKRMAGIGPAASAGLLLNLERVLQILGDHLTTKPVHR